MLKLDLWKAQLKSVNFLMNLKSLQVEVLLFTQNTQTVIIGMQLKLV